MTRHRATLERDLAHAAQLGDDDLQLLMLLAARALEGEGRYGRLDVQRDGRDVEHEALEEVVDGLFYVVAALLKVRRRDRHHDFVRQGNAHHRR